MQESERKYRNAIRLAELYPGIRPNVEGVLKEMEGFGYRPRIQDAWRSEQAQLEAYNKGTSKVKFGFHNVTGPNGEKEALSADILNDNFPTELKLDYALHLAAAAEEHGLTTGIRWGISDQDAALIDAALKNKDWNARVRIGWDPLHVQVTGITIEEARAGKRPGEGEQKEKEKEEEKKEEPVEHRFRRYSVVNAETGEVREYDLATALKPVTLLPVPYVSQLSEEADEHANDCGPASAVMLVQAYTGVHITPDDFYTRFNITGDPFVSAAKLQNALGNLGVPCDWQAGLTLGDLFVRLAESKPLITLIKYGVLRDAGLTEKAFEGPHFCVVTGIDARNVYVHDPLFTNPAEGEARAYPLNVFYKAWREVGLNPSVPNPERAALVPKTGIGIPYKHTVQVSISALNVRSGPGVNFPVSGTLKKGAVVEITREMSGWGEVPGSGWIYLTYTKNVS